MSSRFSAVLLAGGSSSRMGVDKASIELDGVPLWRRQLQILEPLAPDQLFIAGPPRDEWEETNAIVIPDAESGAGPLAGLVEALRRSSAGLLVTIAVDLPHMTTDYLRELVDSCAADCGVVPSYGERFEPLAAIYPKCALALAETSLAARDLSVQRFAARALTQRLLVAKQITPDERPLFLNMNTPDDLALAQTSASHREHGGTRR